MNSKICFRDWDFMYSDSRGRSGNLFLGGEKDP